MLPFSQKKWRSWAPPTAHRAESARSETPNLRSELGRWWKKRWENHGKSPVVGGKFRVFMEFLEFWCSLAQVCPHQLMGPVAQLISISLDGTHPKRLEDFGREWWKMFHCRAWEVNHVFLSLSNLFYAGFLYVQHPTQVFQQPMVSSAEPHPWKLARSNQGNLPAQKMENHCTSTLGSAVSGSVFLGRMYGLSVIGIPSKATC